jgi:hypothetical protein
MAFAPHKAEVSIEILDVRIAAHDKGILPESQRLQHETVIERFGSLQIADGDIEMIDAPYFDHGCRLRGVRVTILPDTACEGEF